jgi:hypothetical protein
MSRSGTFAYTIEAPCDAATAVALLGDPLRNGELHPLIQSVAEVAPQPGAIASYRITDLLPLGPVRLRIVYEADVITSTAMHVVTVARQRPATTVRNETLVTGTSDGITITVTIALTAPALLFGYAFRTAHSAHLELGERIAHRLTELAARD